MYAVWYITILVNYQLKGTPIKSFFRDCFLHNPMVGPRILWSHASWGNCWPSFMALRRKQILPVDMAISGALGCLQPLAGSLFSHCKCPASAEAVKRSRSHDFLQVSNSLIVDTSPNLAVANDFSVDWFVCLFVCHFVQFRGALGNSRKKHRKQITYGGD